MSKGDFIVNFGDFILFLELIELELWGFVILDSGEEVDLVIVLS